MEEINLIEHYGLLLDKNKMKEGMETLGYHSISGHVFLVEVQQNNNISTKYSTKISYVKDKNSFKAFLCEAREFCKEHNNQTYKDFLHQKEVEKLKNTEKTLQEAISEPGFNQSKKIEILK